MLRGCSLQPNPGFSLSAGGFPQPWALGAASPSSDFAPVPDVALGRQFAEWTSRSTLFTEIQGRYGQRVMGLWAAMLARERGEAYQPVMSPSPGDRRFSAKAWSEQAYFDFLRQGYLLYAAFLTELVDAAELDTRAKERLRFFARQYLDALSPANFIATNPEVIGLALDSRGQTLARGMRNLIADVEKGRISHTDESSFEVGRNLAITPGDVVYRNELIELIQYTPTTETVHARPLVIVPPCINKYYILDLSPENSFVRYAVENGHTVFMIAWRNPTAELGHLGWDDYLRDGVLQGLAVAREVAAIDRVNALGFCVGGSLLSAALAVLAARGEDWVESLTLLTALLDYEDAGEIGLLVDEAGVRTREAAIGGGGILEGRELATVFSTLRANDLVWNYVVNNYLKGRPPDAFDILYWNADSTNLPGPMYCYYVRNMYLENKLRIPGALRMLGEKIDLGSLRMPTYFYASREDHIVPWKSAYRATRLLKGDMRFVLGASGHIAGVINPAVRNRRSFWVNPLLGSEADHWLAQATESAGSWWPDYARWLARFGGGQVAARSQAGNATYKPLGPAPGEYVKFRITR